MLPPSLSWPKSGYTDRLSLILHPVERKVLNSSSDVRSEVVSHCIMSAIFAKCRMIKIEGQRI